MQDDSSFTLPADVDLRSYLLGIFDGEGCISGGQDLRDGRWFLQIGVCMASEPICRLFATQWPGSCSPRKIPSVGGLILWQWQAGKGTAMVEFLEFVAKRSLTKRQQAVAALPLARSIAKYSQPGYRRGVNLHAGQKMISATDAAIREQAVRQLRALNGGRSRFADQISTETLAVPAPSADGDADALELCQPQFLDW